MQLVLPASGYTLASVLTILDCATHDPFTLLKKRTIHRDDATERVVKEIIEDVRTRGDLALLENARKFDAPGLESIVVERSEIDAFLEKSAGEEHPITQNRRDAMTLAGNRIQEFHRRQMEAVTAGWQQVGQYKFAFRKGEPSDNRGRNYGWQSPNFKEGVLGQRLVPLESAGVYVPGGNANYPSSVLMNVLPAKAAGLSDIVVTTPARKDGTLSPEVLYALGLTMTFRAFKIGGAAAIAALALGTESVPRVDKIVGPGNRFVNEAKRQLWGTVGLDGYAGPSEVCVLADDQANARFAAADLLTQIEHAPDNAAFLVTVSRAKLDEILAEVETQLRGAQREETMRTALKNESMAFVARDMAQACEIVDAIAPEHLTLATQDPERTMESIHNAGCILLGEWTPESAGDFCLGPSHTLPTSGAARFGSPVNVLDFLKVQSVSRLTREGLQALTPTIEAFGEMEGFPTHARGASIRSE